MHNVSDFGSARVFAQVQTSVRNSSSEQGLENI